MGFEEGVRKNFHTSAKLAKNAKFLAGVEEAMRVWGEVHGSSAASSSHGVRSFIRCLPVCLPACLPVCLPVCLPICRTPCSCVL